jgi:adenine-specific DNA-methyltransferase
MSDGSTPGMNRAAACWGALTPQLQAFLDYFSYTELSNWWDRLRGAPNSAYVVKTNDEIVKRCVLMASDPGDLVLDPTCGSGTSDNVAE